MNKNLPSFQRYQLAFTARLRDPRNQPPIEDVPKQRMAVYEEIVFNNVFESISACFPVARKVIGKRNWLKLTQAFLREYSANSPLFRKIPEQFLEFLTNHGAALPQPLPPYLTSLCHYEWIELLVATMPADTGSDRINPAGDLARQQPVFTPAMQLLNYEYAVHKISPRHKPQQTQNTQLLVYRNADDNVKFIELNAMTFRLIALLQHGAITGEQALTLLADELNYPQPETLMQFGLEILEDLRNQEVIIGVYD